ncbi:MAG: TolC family protein, partial [Planctomycetota bacterium]|nr:TolC family protein [Planctomycetota bacterium]
MDRQFRYSYLAIFVCGAMLAAGGCSSPGAKAVSAPPAALISEAPRQSPPTQDSSNLTLTNQEVVPLPPLTEAVALHELADTATNSNHHLSSQIADPQLSPIPQPTSDVRLVSAQEQLPLPAATPSSELRPIFESVPPPQPAVPLPNGDLLLPAGSELREITMANVLSSVTGRNPQVAFATQRYAEAYARLIAARVLWLPAINAGVGWNNHAGPLQDSQGFVSQVSRSSLTAGLGVQSIGAGSPVVPGLFANFHSAEAIFQPKIANRAAGARNAAIRTATNDLLLETALAYLDLLRAHQLRAISLDIRGHAEELAKATADFAQSGEGTEADADRAATELSIRQNEVIRTEEEIQVASAKLVQLLN